MSLFENQLSSLVPGSFVRFTDLSGQIVEGIIVENDGKEAVSVQVTSLATMRYSQIGAIQAYQKADATGRTPSGNRSETAAEREEESARAEVFRLSVDKESIAKAHKALGFSEKKVLQKANGKFQSYLQSHDEEKFEDAIRLILDSMDENHWAYNPGVNLFYGYMLIFHGEYSEAAAESLFYASRNREAYCVAYQGANQEDNPKYKHGLYQLAAAFASISLLSDALQAEELSEALAVLEASSAFLQDPSGVEYVLEHAKSADITNRLTELQRDLPRELSPDAERVEDLITKYLANIHTEEAETEEETYEPDPPEEPDVTREYEGKIVAYNLYEEKGTIEGRDGEKYPFELNEIKDISLQNQLKKIPSGRSLVPISVKYRLMKVISKYIACNVRRGASATTNRAVPTQNRVVPVGGRMHDANCLITKHDYRGALTIYQQIMHDGNWDEAFPKIIQCYLSLDNRDNDHDYLEELRAFVAEYADQVTMDSKTLAALQDYYAKIQDYESSIRALNKLIEFVDPAEPGTKLHYIEQKARCYRQLGDYRSAISELLNWIDIVNRNQMTDRYKQRNSSIYLQLAELYFALENYEEAEKYVNLTSGESEQKQQLIDALAARNAAPSSDEDPQADDSQTDADEDEDAEAEHLDVDTEIDVDPAETEISLQDAYEGYVDVDGFDALDLDDQAVIEKAFGFDADHLYCLLTYLQSAAAISEASKRTRTDENGEVVSVAQAIQSVHMAASYAFHSPLIDSAYQSSEVTAAFDEAQKYLPADLSKTMLAASALYTLFHTPSTPDYQLYFLSDALNFYNFEQYPALMPLIGDLASFRNKTGYGMDTFAAYRTENDALNKAISAAENCRKALIGYSDNASESLVQLASTKKQMFLDTESPIRKCLDIAVDNRIDQYQAAQEIMQQLFLRNDVIDDQKVHEYIDKKYKDVCNQIRETRHYTEKGFQSLTGGRAKQLFRNTKDALTCIFDWLSAAKQQDGNDNTYAKQQYEDLAPGVMDKLRNLIASCQSAPSDNGFDWGTESVRRAAEELLAKMEGTYSDKTRRYFFLDFLRGEDILLNDDDLPEIESTFCGVPGFDILSRIERHASEDHPTLSERFTEILSNVETKHNFRTARLIQAYGKDLKIEEITAHENLPQYAACLKQAARQFENRDQEFASELNLCESYGTISNLNGEKDKIMAITNAWYKICKLTGDYGFYARLLAVIRNNISENAKEKGEGLRRQLSELENADCDFGVFRREIIEEAINDQNFSSAEFMMRCILHGDVNAISDYSLEPFDYFNAFMTEYAINFRAVGNAGRDIVYNIFAYAGGRSDRNDLARTLGELTNNTHRETRGGANLLRSWISFGGGGIDRDSSENIDRMTELLTRLGFDPVSVSRDENVRLEAYLVRCRKQIGKVNYAHPIPAFGSESETEGFRVLCLYGNYTCDSLMDTLRSSNNSPKNTLVLLDFAIQLDERRRLARKIKEENTFAKTFLVLDRVTLFYLAKHYAETTVLKRMLAVTLPFAYYQPFVEASIQNMPPELFTGREAELTSIESPNGANLVFGGRQLGKSALLKMARRDVDRNGNGDRAILIEIKGMTAQSALRVVCDKLIAEDIIDACSPETWNDLAGQIQRRLDCDDPEKRVHYLLLMLDEADTFIETCDKTEDQPITALKNLPSDRFKLVMAGLHNLSRYNRKLMHDNSNLIHLKPITIKQFGRKEATKLLTRILAYLGFQFNQSIINSILASTYNYPGLIQLYCQKLLEAMKNDDYAGYSESLTPPYKVTEAHYKKILSDQEFADIVDQKFEASLFVEEKGHSNYHVIALILAYLYYENAESKEKGYSKENLLGCAKDFEISRVTSMQPEQLSEILSEMCDLNVITVMDGCYRFATDGFRKYLGDRDKVEKSMDEYIEEETV